ncbi:hypothetical protein Cgig2_013871 [Carnegiea gigantea]|uniref:Uncharacterized protein n=1 Tax=Carnegiea gigantea TaxID=171969 RepID=A0A9Q1KJW0_9CARY|nr:hypothetical protein Cgig2_013871 [Carnegiea gigantea]
MESRERQTCIQNEATPVSDSSFISDDDVSAFEALEEDRDNLPNNPSMSLEAEVSGSSGDMVMLELRSKKLHDKGGTSEALTRMSKIKGDVAVAELRLKKVHDKGGSSKVESLKPRRLRCTPEAVCNLNSELEDSKKSAIEETAFKISQREVPFLVYDVAFLMGLPATSKHVPFERGQGGCKYRASYGSNRGNERENPYEEKSANTWLSNDTSDFPLLKVRELERKQPKIKAFSETDDFRAYVEDAQGIISIEERLQRTREELRIEKEAHAATKKELEYMRELLIGMGQEDSIPGCGQNEGLELAQRAKGSRKAHETSIAASDHDNSDTIRNKLHNVDLASIEDVEECDVHLEPTGQVLNNSLNLQTDYCAGGLPSSWHIAGLRSILVAQKVFKSKSRDSVVGYGGGVKTKDIRGPSRTRVELEVELNATRKKNKVLVGHVTTVKTENESLQNRVEAVEAEMGKFKDWVSKQLNINVPSYANTENGNPG